MNKFGMQEYLENNLSRILTNHFKVIEDEMYCGEYGLTDLSEMVDDISFYKEWSKDAKYEVSIFLREIEDCEDEGEGEEISD